MAPPVGRRWDVNDVLLKDAGMWAQYGPLMRADFRLFDEFEWRRGAEGPLPMPAVCFHAQKDKKARAQGSEEGWRTTQQKVLESVSPGDSR